MQIAVLAIYQAKYRVLSWHYNAPSVSFGGRKTAKSFRELPAVMRELAGFLHALPNNSPEQKMRGSLFDEGDRRERTGRPRSTEGRDLMIERLCFFLKKSKPGGSYQLVADLLNWAHGLELEADDVKKACGRLKGGKGVAVWEYWKWT
jgi:hypothetical protein